MERVTTKEQGIASNAPSWARVLAGIALALASAVMLTVSFPPYGWWPLIFVAAIPFLLAQYRILPARWSALAPAVAIGGWIGVYFSKIFGFGGGGAWYMRTLPLWIGLLVLFTEQANRPLHERTDYRWFVVQGVVGWIGFEMIRTFIPNLGTWAFVGYPLYAQGWLIQPVSVFGILGLDMLIVSINFVLAQAAFMLFDRRWRWENLPAVNTRSAGRWLVGVGSACAL